MNATIQSRVLKTIPGKEWVGKWCCLINIGIENDTCGKRNGIYDNIHIPKTE